MEFTSNEAAEATTIHDLNDDCLLALFEYLGLQDLCAVADVCSRFRAIARASFAHSKPKTLDLPDDIGCRFPSVHNKILLRTSRVLRNFGPFITDIFDFAKYCRSSPPDYLNDEMCSECEREFFDLLIRYCSGTLTHLSLRRTLLPNEVVLKMRPLFRGIHKLGLFNRELPALSASWFPELRELELGNIIPNQSFQYDCLHETFPKLERISFHSLHGFMNYDIEKILQCNPKLKEIELDKCKNLGTNTLWAIAEYAKKVEKLNLNFHFQKPNPNAKYFSGLHKLSSLALCLLFEPDYVTSVICEIAEAGIPLKYLRLGGLWMEKNSSTQQAFIDGMSKLTKLETLVLVKSQGLNATDINSICEHLKDLRELQLESFVALTADDLLMLVGNAEKLEQVLLVDTFPIYDHGRKCNIIIDFDGKTFQKIVNIVKKRSKRTRLNIYLNTDCYNVAIPDELAKANKDFVVVNDDKDLTRYANGMNKYFRPGNLLQ